MNGNILLFLGNIRGFQLIIIILVILLLFGSKKIPDIMRGLGKGVHSFKQGLADAKEEINKPIEKPEESSVRERQDVAKSADSPKDETEKQA